MRSEVFTAQQIFNHNTPMVVPLYQRPYRWSPDQAIQLLDDISSASQRKFIGAVTIIQAGAGNPQQIIDGQQRITTICLILIAIRDKLKQFNESTENNINIDQINNLLFIYNANGGRPRLTPKPLDADLYNDLLNGKEPSQQNNSQINDNYQEIISIISNRFKTATSLIELKRKIFENTVIVSIYAEVNEDPQEIFESLNTTGKQLTTMELACNLLFMRITPEQQATLHDQYWQYIEEAINGDEDIGEDTIGEYISLKTKNSQGIQRSKVYNEFKNYFLSKLNENNNVYETTNLLAEEILDYIKAVKNIKTNQIYSEVLSWNIGLIMPLLYTIEKKAKNQDEKIESLKIIDSYIARRVICEMPNQSLKRAFYSAANSIWQQEDVDSVHSTLHKHLSNLKNKLAFPNNDQLREKIKSFNLYGSTHNKKILNTCINTNNHGFTIQVHDFSIEHIMPQTLNETWRNTLGVEHNQIHSTLLHTIGNLLVVPMHLNSKLGNMSFKEKKEILNGEAEFRGKLVEDTYSNLHFVRAVTEQVEWGKEQILNRCEAMAEILINKYKEPKTYNEPPQNNPIKLTDEQLRSYTQNQSIIEKYRTIEAKLTQRNLTPNQNATYISFTQPPRGVILSIRLQQTQYMIAFNSDINDPRIQNIINQKNEILRGLNIHLRNIANLDVGMQGDVQLTIRRNDFIDDKILLEIIEDFINLEID